MKQGPHGWALLLLLSGLLGCDNLSEFSTDANSCYKGSIIDADFVRSGSFDANVRITMALNVNALANGNEEGAVITTSDGRFRNASVKQMLELTRDSLSELNFPGGRTRSFLAYAPDVDGVISNVVISLMENGDVEVRIFRPAVAPDAPLYGVFRAVLKDDCTPPASSGSAPDTAAEKDAGDSASVRLGV